MSSQFQKNDPVETRFHNESDIERKERCKGLRWWAAGAVFGLAGAFGFPMLVALFARIFTQDLGAQPFLQTLTKISTLSIIPLLILGGYCLNQAITLATPKTFGSCSRSVLPDHKPDKGIQLALTFTVLCGMAAIVHAQQTVFNVPTTDVLDKGKVYFELDISAKPNDSDALNRFSSFVPRIVVGTGGRVEIGLNSAGNIQPGPDSTTLVPAVKWKVYDGRDNGWAIAVGNNLFLPVRNKSYDVGTYSYVMVQKSFKAKTRIGFGGNFFSKNVVAPDANRAGGQFTVEQPITSRFGVQADWFTGRHANGYFTPGGYFKFTKKVAGLAAYSIGNANAKKGNHFLYFELAWNIN